MKWFSHKFIVVLLMLLVGLAPLQSAFAGLENSAWQIASTHQILADSAMDMDVDHAMNSECDQCTTDNCCSGQDCALSHCASCVPAVPAVSVLQGYGEYTAIVDDIRHGFALIPSSSPFRPPIS